MQRFRCPSPLPDLFFLPAASSFSNVSDRAIMEKEGDASKEGRVGRTAARGIKKSSRNSEKAVAAAADSIIFCLDAGESDMSGGIVG
jgi:hypothetical protein